jgi:hypothetical protein
MGELVGEGLARDVAVEIRVLGAVTLVQNSSRTLDFAASPLCENRSKCASDRLLKWVFEPFERFLFRCADLDSILQGTATSSWPEFHGPLFSM